jgi:Spy/CpxP family protein refolding chaperone
VKAWKAILAILVIFCAGLVVGSLVMKRISAASPAAALPAGSRTGAPGQYHLQTLLKRMDRELALTPEQDAQIKQIISASQERSRELWKPVAQAMSTETASACEQIREVLTPEQQEKFDVLSKSRPERGGRSDHGDRGDRDGRDKHRGDWDLGTNNTTNAGTGGE